MSLESITQTIRGSAASANSSIRKGWLVGHFMPEGTIAYCKDLEIKSWHYDKDPNYGLKVFMGTEFISVEHGTIQIEFEKPSKANATGDRKSTRLNSSH